MCDDCILDIRCFPIVVVQSIAMPYSVSVSVCKCINVSEYQCREKKKNFPIGDARETARTRPFLGGVKSTLSGGGEVRLAEAIAEILGMHRQRTEALVR